MSYLLRTALLLILVAPFQERATTVFMIGDSTMADKPLEDNPERGWGQMFPELFDSSVRFENHARNGRSTGSFIREGRWDSVMSRLHEGDFVIIQFGHNDQSKEKGDRYTPPDAFRQNLRRFVLESRSKGASPILCTPVMRRRFDSTGTFYDVHGAYPDLTREVARELDVPLLDMHRGSERVIVEHGKEASKKLFLHIPPGVYASLPDGKTDDTHFSEYGARIMANLAAAGLRSLDHPLASRLRSRE